LYSRYYTVEANYRLTQSIARPLYNSRATCLSCSVVILQCGWCRSSSRASHQQHVIHMQPVTSVVEVAPPMEPLEIAGDDSAASWRPDPNEPRYCLCNDVSYGDMVGCDNEDVSKQLVVALCLLSASVSSVLWCYISIFNFFVTFFTLPCSKLSLVGLALDPVD